MSRRQIRLLVEARQDLQEGRRFYDRLQLGIGDYFWDSLLADMESLHIYAGVHERQCGHFRMLAKRFPYALYYNLDEDFVTVVAILPLRRAPAWLSKQLGGRTRQ